METIRAAGRARRGKETSAAVWPTSGLVELQGDVSVEAQAEVVVEHVEGQLRRQERVKVSHLSHTRAASDRITSCSRI